MRAAAPAADVEVIGRPRPAGADPLRQLGDPPERRRGRRRASAIRVHVDGRTAAASATVVGEDGLDGLVVARRWPPRRWRPLDPGWPGVAPPAPLGRRRRRSTRRRATPRPTTGPTIVARVRRRRRRAGDGRLLPHRTTGAARSPTRPVRRVGGERRRRRPGRHRPRATAPTASPGSRRAGSPTSTAPCSARAPRPRRGAGGRPGRAAAGPLRGRARADGRRRHPRGALDVRLQRQGRRRAALVRAPRRGPVRPAVTLVDDAAAAGVRVRRRGHADAPRRPRRRRRRPSA